MIQLILNFQDYVIKVENCIFYRIYYYHNIYPYKITKKIYHLHDRSPTVKFLLQILTKEMLSPTFDIFTLNQYHLIITALIRYSSLFVGSTD